MLATLGVAAPSQFEKYEDTENGVRGKGHYPANINTGFVAAVYCHAYSARPFIIIRSRETSAWSIGSSLLRPSRFASQRAIRILYRPFVFTRRSLFVERIGRIVKRRYSRGGGSRVKARHRNRRRTKRYIPAGWRGPAFDSRVRKPDIVKPSNGDWQ